MTDFSCHSGLKYLREPFTVQRNSHLVLNFGTIDEKNINLFKSLLSIPRIT